MTKIMIHSHESLSTLVQAFTTNGESNLCCNRAWDYWPSISQFILGREKGQNARWRFSLYQRLIIIKVGLYAVTLNVRKRIRNVSALRYVTENDDPLTPWGTSILF